MNITKKNRDAAPNPWNEPATSNATKKHSVETDNACDGRCGRCSLSNH